MVQADDLTSNGGDSAAILARLRANGAVLADRLVGVDYVSEEGLQACQEALRGARDYLLSISNRAISIGTLQILTMKQISLLQAVKNYYALEFDFFSRSEHTHDDDTEILKPWVNIGTRHDMQHDPLTRLRQLFATIQGRFSRHQRKMTGETAALWSEVQVVHAQVTGVVERFARDQQQRVGASMVADGHHEASLIL